MMRRLLLLSSIACSFLAGITIGVKSAAVQTMFADVQRNVRVSLGLPKMWVPLPNPIPPESGRLPCPDAREALVIVTGGQSNAANTNSVLSQTVPEDRVYTFYNGACYIAADPVLGASGGGGSLWPDLGRRLAYTTGKPILFVHGAIGGTQVSDWLDERSGYLEHLLSGVKAVHSHGYRVNWILWHQGETDALVQSDQTVFISELRTLTQKLLDTMPEARVYLFRASKCVGGRRVRGVPMIREAQSRVAMENPRIVLGVDTDQFGDDFRYDQCHLNSHGRTAVNELVASDLTTH